MGSDGIAHGVDPTAVGPNCHCDNMCQALEEWPSLKAQRLTGNKTDQEFSHNFCI